jgi:hypothetical protein
MNRPIRAGDYVEHFDPELDHHRAWLLAVLEILASEGFLAMVPAGSDPVVFAEGYPQRHGQDLARLAG